MCSMGIIMPESRGMGARRARCAAAVWFAAALLAFVAATPAAAAEFVMKFGTATMNETQHQFMKFYKEEVE
jgi:TRAP-type C4-dicarboxylate transport system substrate-binding protein